MGFDPVPWLVGGGAQHSPEVARVLAYAAFRGNEGVMGYNDLRVSALSVPGAAVEVAPGACSILNRATGGEYQAYAGRNISTEQVAIAATGASARSDMIVARVEDPYLAGEPWADPADPTVGPYIFLRVISNVPSTATTVTGLGLGQSAIPLARIDIPANTGTITGDMIVNLRSLANPRRERRMYTVNPTSTNAEANNGSFTNWPSQASWSIDIPSWAAGMVATWTVNGVKVNRAGTTTDGNIYGQTRISIGGTYPDGQITQGASYDIQVDYSVKWDRYTLGGGDTRSIPTNIRGTTQTMRMQATGAGNSALVADTGTSVTVDIEFYESTL